MGKRLVLVLCILVSSGIPAWSDAPLIEAYDPSHSEIWTVAIQLENGYETGYIPDWVIAPRISVTVPYELRVGLSLDVAYLARQGLSRVNRSGLDVAYSLFPSTSPLQLAFIVGGDFAWNGAVVVPYSGTTSGITNVTSPRADTGFDLTGAVAAHLELPSVRSLGLSAATELRYDFTGGRRSYESEYGFLPGLHRLTAILSPEVALPQQHLDFAMQNRFLYWFSRGFGYEALPQVTWSPDWSPSWAPGKSWRVQAGIGVPLVGGGTWRFIVAAGFEVLPRRPPPSGKRKETKRLVVNFQFEGDQADLLEPENKTYGKDNARLIAEILRVLREYPDASIVIEGNANRAKFALSFEEEQERELIPLSLARAESVRKALIQGGIPAGNLRAVGNGAAKPVVDFHDLENVWRNRRVEIVIQSR